MDNKKGRENYSINNINSEKGIASILALAMLGLLIVVALGFITESLIFKETARNTNSLVKARMLARSTLNRARAALETDTNINDSVKTIYSPHQNDDPTNTDELSSLTTTLNKVKYYDWGETDGNSADEDSPRWQYFYESNGFGTKIYGRVAFVGFADTPGFISPSAVVDSGINQDNIAVTEDTAYSESRTSYTTRGRPGRNLNEIYLSYLDPNPPSNNNPLYLGDEELIKLSSENSPDMFGFSPKLPAGEKWIDMETLYSKVGISSQDDRTKFKKWFTTAAPKSPEAFWIDENTDNVTQISSSNYELYHRFNLRRDDWDSINIGDISNTSAISYDQDYSETNVTAIPWLKNWDTVGDMNTKPQCRKQVTANLIDYCDTDTKATTDYPTEDPPNYVGLDKSPYINEINLAIKGYIEEYIDDDDQYWYYLHIDVDDSAELELINMYSDTLKQNCKATINISARAKWHTGDDDHTNNFSNSFEMNFSSDLSPDTYITKSFSEQILIEPDNKFDGHTYSEKRGDLKIQGFKIKNLNIKLTHESDTNKLLDYSTLLGDDNSTSSEKLSSSSDTGFLYLDMQTDDPQQNLSENDWYIKNWSSDNLNNIGETNESSSEDPLEISTAYIRNDKMKSPWELGFIHRGSAWQTINLKSYNNTENPGQGGGDSYSEGDANILDQVKMSSDTQTYGKINLNAATLSDNEAEIKDIYRSLFTGIHIGSPKSNPGIQSDTPITWEDADSISKNLYNSLSTSDDTLQTRSQVVNELGLEDYDDASKEEIIGKFINLTKVGVVPGKRDFYTVIVVAQMINDIGGGITIKKDLDQDGEIQDDETFEDVKYGEYNPNVDEILGEQKLLAVLVRDPDTFKWHIRKLLFLGD